MKNPPDSSASEDLGTDFKKALDAGWLPIREVSRQTGSMLSPCAPGNGAMG